MRYEKFKFLYPPRPEYAVTPDFIGYHEQRGWVGQYKKNGTCGIIAISPTKEVICLNRYGEKHKRWFMSPDIEKFLTTTLPEPNWFYLCAEILDAKTPSIKQTIYIFDVIVWNGDYMVDSTFAERSRLLDERFKTSDESYSHYVCSNGVWYAKQFESNLTEIFKGIEDPTIDEGLVLRASQGKLQWCDKKDSNRGWLVKCRHPTKNYQF